MPTTRRGPLLNGQYKKGLISHTTSTTNGVPLPNDHLKKGPSTKLPLQKGFYYEKGFITKLNNHCKKTSATESPLAKKVLLPNCRYKRAMLPSMINQVGFGPIYICCLFSSVSKFDIILFTMKNILS